MAAASACRATDQAARPERVCVVGAGIAGMSAAYHIAKHAKATAGRPAVEVTLVEGGERIGGHAMSHSTQWGLVDLGYMVMNFECYPNLTRFYREHHIPLVKTDMGFSIQSSGYAWAFGSALGNYAKAALNPSFWRLILSKHRFHSDALAFIQQCDALSTQPPSITLRQFCKDHQYHAAFVDGWLGPFCEAVWSSPTSAALEMEAYTILSFLRNHGFLGWTLMQWYTPQGRTAVTLDRFLQLFQQHGVTIRVGTKVIGIERPVGDAIQLKLADGSTLCFDKVVLATPSGTALQLLTDADATDRAVLDGFSSTTTKIVLHTDKSMMPVRREHWCSWNVIESTGLQDRSILSYWVQPLQHIPHEHLFITLNPPTGDLGPAHELVLHERWASHPTLNVAAAQAQRRVWSTYQGHRGVWLAGAYLHYGFHEDGFRSGIEVARSVLENRSIPLMPVSHDGNSHYRFSGRTSHTRFNENGKVVHSFSYNVEYDYVNVDAGFTAWWGGLFRRDHFGDPADSLSEAVRKEVARSTGVWPIGAVDVLTTFREFGSVFNPITLFLVWDSTQRNSVEFVVSEVTNTPWGQRTVQVLDVASAAINHKGDQHLVIERPKTLHVSPFNEVPDGTAIWRYTLKLPDRTLNALEVTVDLLKTPQASTPTVRAKLMVENTGSPYTFVRSPVPTAWKTLWRIHFEAFRLYMFKGLNFHSNTTQSGWSECAATDLFNGDLWIRFALLAIFTLCIGLWQIMWAGLLMVTELTLSVIGERDYAVTQWSRWACFNTTNGH